MHFVYSQFLTKRMLKNNKTLKTESNSQSQAGRRKPSRDNLYVKPTKQHKNSKPKYLKYINQKDVCLTKKGSSTRILNYQNYIRTQDDIYHRPNTAHIFGQQHRNQLLLIDSLQRGKDGDDLAFSSRDLTELHRYLNSKIQEMVKQSICQLTADEGNLKNRNETEQSQKQNKMQNRVSTIQIQLQKYATESLTKGEKIKNLQLRIDQLQSRKEINQYQLQTIQKNTMNLDSDVKFMKDLIQEVSKQIQIINDRQLGNQQSDCLSLQCFRVQFPKQIKIIKEELSQLQSLVKQNYSELSSKIDLKAQWLKETSTQTDSFLQPLKDILKNSYISNQQFEIFEDDFTNAFQKTLSQYNSNFQLLHQSISQVKQQMLEIASINKLLILAINKIKNQFACLNIHPTATSLTANRQNNSMLSIQERNSQIGKQKSQQSIQGGFQSNKSKAGSISKQQRMRELDQKQKPRI